MGDYKIFLIYLNVLNSNLSFIRSFQFSEMNHETLNKKYNFIDKAGKIVPSEEESKIMINEILKLDQTVNYHYLEIDLNPKLYKEVKKFKND